MGPWSLSLELPTGSRLPIRPAGVLIGRAPRCDVVLADPSASRTQAVVFAGPEGPCLIVLGKGSTAVDGDAVAGERELSVGARIELPGLVLIVVTSSGVVEPSPSTWVVRGPAGHLFGVVRSPFIIGRARTADLRLAAGPDQVLRFHLADRLHVEAMVPLVVDGRQLASGELEALGTGSAIVHGDDRFEVVTGGTLGDDSTTTGAPAGVHAVRLEFLVRGGRLTATRGGRATSVYLPERRCDLIAALLRPPTPFSAGDDVPDDVLLPRVWPGREMARSDLNVLLHRARHDLVRAGLDGAALLRRAEGGTATRFVLARGARIEVV